MLKHMSYRGLKLKQASAGVFQAAHKVNTKQVSRQSGGHSIRPGESRHQGGVVRASGKGVPITSRGIRSGDWGRGSLRAYPGPPCAALQAAIP